MLQNPRKLSQARHIIVLWACALVQLMPSSYACLKSVLMCCTQASRVHRAYPGRNLRDFRNTNLYHLIGSRSAQFREEKESTVTYQ
jgi:hypothetical protein